MLARRGRIYPYCLKLPDSGEVSCEGVTES